MIYALKYIPSSSHKSYSILPLSKDHLNNVTSNFIRLEKILMWKTYCYDDVDEGKVYYDPAKQEERWRRETYIGGGSSGSVNVWPTKSRWHSRYRFVTLSVKSSWKKKLFIVGGLCKKCVLMLRYLTWIIYHYTTCIDYEKLQSQLIYSLLVKSKFHKIS